MNSCEFPGCPRKAGYASYRLHEDGTKTFGHFCVEHEREIAEENARLRRQYPGKQWYVPSINPELVLRR